MECLAFKLRTTPGTKYAEASIISLYLFEKKPPVKPSLSLPNLCISLNNEHHPRTPLPDLSSLLSYHLPYNTYLIITCDRILFVERREIHCDFEKYPITCSFQTTCSRGYPKFLPEKKLLSPGGSPLSSYLQMYSIRSRLVERLLA